MTGIDPRDVEFAERLGIAQDSAGYKRSIILIAAYRDTVETEAVARLETALESAKSALDIANEKIKNIRPSHARRFWREAMFVTYARIGNVAAAARTADELTDAYINRYP